MRPSTLRQFAGNVSRSVAGCAAILAVLISAGRTDSGACLRVLGYETRANPNGTGRGGSALDAMLIDVNRGSILRETRYPARSEVGFSPTAGRAVYSAPSVGRPNADLGGQYALILQGKSGLFAEDQVVQDHMASQIFDFGSSLGRRIAWSADGSKMAFLWERGIQGDPTTTTANSGLIVVDVATGAKQSVGLDSQTSLCCLGAFSPDSSYLVARRGTESRQEFQLWRANPLQVSDPDISFVAGAWLPGGHEFVGIGQSNALPGVLSFMRWSDGVKRSIPLTIAYGSRTFLGAYLAPDSQHIAIESITTACIPGNSKNCNATYLFDIFGIDGSLIAPELNGRFQSAYTVTPTMRGINRQAQWSGDSTRFVYTQQTQPQSLTVDLMAYDLREGKSVTMAENIADRFAESLFFSPDLDRYYDPAALKSGLAGRYAILPTLVNNQFSVAYRSLDGSTQIPLIDKADLIFPLESFYNEYAPQLGWALDGRTIIVPWLRSNFSAPKAGITWIDMDGGGRREIVGLENVSDVNVAVDGTIRGTRRWIGYFGVREGKLYFELAHQDSERQVRVELPKSGRITSWTTWFSPDERYVAAFIGDRQSGNAFGYLYLIDLQTGQSTEFPDSFMAAWAKQGHRLALVRQANLTQSAVVEIINADDRSLQKMFPLVNYEFGNIAAMSWNPCY